MINNGFTRKKVKDLTLGEKLRQIRSERRISLNEVSKKTQIQINYLEYLEAGKYDNLPAEVYVKGFLRNYANFLGVDSDYLIKLYDREKGIQRNIKKEKEDRPFSRKKLIKISNFVIVSKATAIAIALIMVFIAAAYLYKEINKFVSMPRLTIFEPANEITVNSDEIWIKGITDKDCEVFINGQPILVNAEGGFNEKINLQKGANFINVVSRNRFEKESSVSISIQSDYEEEVANGNGESGEVKGEQEVKMKAEIYVDSDAVWLSVKIDGNLAYSGTLSSQVSQIFEVQKEISVTSGKGNHTFIKINGEEKGALSEEEGTIKDVVFKINE